MGHEHASKVLEWEYKLVDGDMIPYAALYGCVGCEATSPKPFPDESDIFIDTLRVDLIALVVRLEDFR
jgi:hypothetical protein